MSRIGRTALVGRVGLVGAFAVAARAGVRAQPTTWQSQFVKAQTAARTVVLASDNMYLYENLETQKPSRKRSTPRRTCGRSSECARWSPIPNS